MPDLRRAEARIASVGWRGTAKAAAPTIALKLLEWWEHSDFLYGKALDKAPTVVKAVMALLTSNWAMALALLIGLIWIGIQLSRAPVPREPSRSDEIPVSGTDGDTELTDALLDAAHNRAWGRLVAAEQVRDLNGRRDEHALIRNMAENITKAATNGTLAVRGRIGGVVESISAATWHAVELRTEKDATGRWHASLVPRVTADPFAVRREQSYESLMVDVRQFDAVFPKRHSTTDERRRNALAEAKAKGVEEYLFADLWD